MDDSTYNLTIRNNHIHHIGFDYVPDNGSCPPGQHVFGDYCIYFSASDSLLEGNELDHCDAYGIHNYVHGQVSTNNIIRNNYIHDNGWLILLACGGDKMQFYNNIVANNGGGGLLLGSTCEGAPSTNSQVYNNTIYHNAGNCIDLGVSGAGVTVTNSLFENNICYQNSSDVISVNNGTGNVIDHNLLGTNPLFVNASGGDFHLQSGSPAIDAGVVIPGLSFNGSDPDLGALETGAGGQLPAPMNLRLIVN